MFHFNNKEIQLMGYTLKTKRLLIIDINREIKKRKRSLEATTANHDNRSSSNKENTSYPSLSYPHEGAQSDGNQRQNHCRCQQETKKKTIATIFKSSIQ